MSDKYEKLYAAEKNALGAPFQTIVDFFAGFDGQKLDVLDVGCGQGRDAIFIARLGHHVTGVDLSPAGITDMMRAADQEGLDITGIVADVADWVPQERFDVVLFDRVLHMLEPTSRLVAAAQLSAHTRVGGYVLIADEVKNLAGIIAALPENLGPWQETYRNGGQVFLRAAP